MRFIKEWIYVSILFGVFLSILISVIKLIVYLAERYGSIVPITIFFFGLTGLFTWLTRNMPTPWDE